MADKDTIDDMVDKLIDEVLESTDKDELKKRRPKPFRYLTDKEFDNQIYQEKEITPSVMKSPDQPKIVEKSIFIAGMGDTHTIENVIRKHEVSRKFKDKK